MQFVLPAFIYNWLLRPEQQQINYWFESEYFKADAKQNCSSQFLQV